MAEYRNIFKEDVDVPDVVTQKANAVFLKIKEDADHMEEKFEKKKITRISFFKKRIAAAACICLLAASGITAAAAIHHVWSRGTQGLLQATDEQQQRLTDKGIATVLSESEDYTDMAVTNGNVTVAPETVIVDERFAYLSFSVKGYALKEGTEPSFESTRVYLGDDPDSEDSGINMYASFYSGIVSDGMGHPVYEDGRPLEKGSDGNIIQYYADENGNLEYVIQAFVSDPEKSLLGKTLHVSLRDLGTVYHAFQGEDTGLVEVEGIWDFAIDLPAVSSATNMQVAETVDGTAFVMDSIDISPVSIKINYSVTGEIENKNDDNGIPEFCGVILTDGTRLPFIMNGGLSAYTDANKTNAYVLSAFDRVIEPERVASILVRTEPGPDLVEVPLSR